MILKFSCLDNLIKTQVQGIFYKVLAPTISMAFLDRFRKKKKAPRPRKRRKAGPGIQAISQDTAQDILREIKALYLLLGKHDQEIKGLLPGVKSPVVAEAKLALIRTIKQEFLQGKKPIEIAREHPEISQAGVYRTLRRVKIELREKPREA